MPDPIRHNPAVQIHTGGVRSDGQTGAGGGEVSVKCSEPQSPTKSGEYQRHLQAVLYSTSECCLRCWG
eukprot:6926097-Pyramimonas_sp.AAC.1